MNKSEIKSILINSLDKDADPAEARNQLEENGVSFGFNEHFTEKVVDRLFNAGVKISREVDYLRSLNLVFYRIALTGVAAIIILLISIYLKEGSLSLNSFLGLNDTNAESIICLLTGN